MLAYFKRGIEDSTNVSAFFKATKGNIMSLIAKVAMVSGPKSGEERRVATFYPLSQID